MSKKGVMQCLLAECSLYWFEPVGRFFTARELLLMMGFPVYKEILAILQPRESHDSLISVCSFNENRSVRVGVGRKRAALSHQAGNSMCVTAIGSVVLFVLAFLEIHDDAPTGSTAVVSVDRPLSDVRAQRFLSRLARSVRDNCMPSAPASPLVCISVSDTFAVADCVPIDGPDECASHCAVSPPVSSALFISRLTKRFKTKHQSSGAIGTHTA